MVLVCKRCEFANEVATGAQLLSCLKCGSAYQNEAAALGVGPTDAARGYSGDDKLQWEVLKLQAETKNLCRPFVRQPVFWIGLGTLMLSMFTNLIQFSNVERNKQLAEIKTMQLSFDAQQLAQQKIELTNQIEKIKRDGQLSFDTTRESVANLNKKLNDLKAEIGTAGETRDSLMRSIAALQVAASNVYVAAETASSSLASAGLRNADEAAGVSKAAQYEEDAFAALMADDFAEALRLFQASERVSPGFHFSYEWTRLLRARQDDLKTANGKKEVLRQALANGYARFVTKEARGRLEEESR